MKVFYVCLGLGSLVLGTIGSFVPLIPTVPLYLLATFCFARSSKRLHDWFTGTRIYKDNLEDYVKGEGMTKQVKTRILATITISIAIGFIVVKNLPVVRVILVCVWLGLTLYFCLGVNTKV